MCSNRVRIKLILFFFIFFQALHIFFFKAPTPVDSGSLTAASDTLSNSRLSFSGKVSGTYAAGSSIFTMQSSSNPDVNTNHLFPQDTIAIGTNAPQTVATISASTVFGTTTGITNQLADGNDIIASQSATHTIGFTTASTVVDGAIRVLIPGSSNNCIPIGGSSAGFNFCNMTGSDVTCPTGGSVTWESATATNSATFGNSTHAFECRFRGSLANATALTMTIGGTNKLINPAPKTGHSQGTADTHLVRIQELSYGTGYGIVDSVTVTVSPIEAVLVSTTVNPSLSFQIAGVAAGQSICGTGAGRDTNVATTSTSVPFGELTGSDAFYNAAHSLSVATNATSGYTVKVGEDSRLAKPTDISTFIPNTTCDAGPCTYDTTNQATKQLWSTSTSYGWGYSLRNVSSTTTFQYDDTTNGCVGGGSTNFCARPFACTVAGNCGGSANAEQRIAYSSGPSGSQSLWVCYRLNYSSTQATGYYQTRVMYYASATF